MCDSTSSVAFDILIKKIGELVNHQLLEARKFLEHIILGLRCQRNREIVEEKFQFLSLFCP